MGASEKADAAYHGTPTCTICDKRIMVNDDKVECLDWPGREHHRECARYCTECKHALADQRRGI